MQLVEQLFYCLVIKICFVSIPIEKLRYCTSEFACFIKVFGIFIIIRSYCVYHVFQKHFSLAMYDLIN